jgi:DNA-binding LytR/AlgR family response regulator
MAAKVPVQSARWPAGREPACPTSAWVRTSTVWSELAAWVKRWRWVAVSTSVALTNPFERFLKAVQRVYDARVVGPPIAPVAPEPVDSVSGFFVKTDSRLVQVNFADIRYIEGGREYATLVLTTTKLLTLTSLHKLLESLPAAQFIRVHKSYIVALNQIKFVERQRIHLANAVIPVGGAYRDKFLKLLRNDI